MGLRCAAAAPLLAALLGVATGCTPNAIAGTEPRGDARSEAAPGAAPSAGAAVGGDAGAAPGLAGAGAGASANQDEALPALASEDLTRRAKHLVEAIAQDSPHLAGDFMFPREGYVAAKDAQDPSRAWDKTVSAPFAKRVHVLHKRMKGLERGQFVGIELGHTVTQITPRKKDFKKPLWRVKHSKILVNVDGRMQRIELGELTSYRGAWYVTRL